MIHQSLTAQIVQEAIRRGYSAFPEFQALKRAAVHRAVMGFVQVVRARVDWIFFPSTDFILQKT